MKTVLYFKNEYIDNISQLCGLFRGNINEELKRELIASFQDGALESWLKDNDCKDIYEKLKVIDKNEPNQELLLNLKHVFTDEKEIKQIISSDLDFNDYCHLEEVSFEKIDMEKKEISECQIIRDEMICFDTKQFIFRLNFKIKVLNPDNEKICLKLETKQNNFSILTDTKSLYINVHKNDFVNVSFIVNLKHKDKSLYKIFLENKGNILWTSSISNLKLNPCFSPKATKEQIKAINQLLENMVYVIGGTFEMGARKKEEKILLKSYNYEDIPLLHKVAVSDYYISKFQLTEEIWYAIMGKRYQIEYGDNLPVYNITWDNAKKFILRIRELSNLKFNFPTEAQWEYAARGGGKSKGYIYSGSNDLDKVAWYGFSFLEYQLHIRTRGFHPHPIGKKEPNELGLYDMSGNVSEFCYDHFSNYTKRESINPKGPKNGYYRVHRGGDFSAECYRCILSYRSCGSNDYRGYCGLRLVVNIADDAKL